MTVLLILKYTFDVFDSDHKYILYFIFYQTLNLSIIYFSPATNALLVGNNSPVYFQNTQ